MKNLVLVFVAMFFYVSACAQEKKAASPAMTAESDNVSVTYNSPFKKGRVIFGDLVPYNKVWRTGANGATQVTFKKDVVFGDAKVAAGTYALFTVPGEGEWTVVLNSVLGQWGAYKYDATKNIAEIKVPAESTNETESLTIDASDESIDIKWDKTKVSIPLEF